MLSRFKDHLASSAARNLLASGLERYGKLTDFRIRSTEKTVAAELILEGDEVPVRIEVTRYRVTGKSPEYFIIVESVIASRPWIQNLLQDFLVEKPQPIPSLFLLALGGPQD